MGAKKAELFMDMASRVFVAGHGGLVGSAVMRGLERAGYRNVLVRTRRELDLLDVAAVTDFFAREQPEFVFLAAAKVGGILANNTYPAEFLRENLILQTNVIEASRRSGVKRLLFLGSSCIYPTLAPQPMEESCLLMGPPEATNRPYAVAKIAGIEMCWAYNRQYGTRYLAAMPTNLYGPGDNFDLESSHVLAALLRKMAEAMAAGVQEVVVWGTGTPRRELLYVDDLAEACLFLMNLDEVRFGSLLREDRAPVINIGTGEDLTIRELAETVARMVGFEGRLVFDASKPDGTPRKLLDLTRMKALGWGARTSLAEGIGKTWSWWRNGAGAGAGVRRGTLAFAEEGFQGMVVGKAETTWDHGRGDDEDAVRAVGGGVDGDFGRDVGAGAGGEASAAE